MFMDREDAGWQLACHLEPYRGSSGIVLAIPRGGIPVGAEIARRLKMPLEALLSKKISHPNQPEYAIGAVSLTDRVLQEPVEAPFEYITQETERLRAQIREQARRLMGDWPPAPLEGLVSIIADDGVATGHTLCCAIAMLRRRHPLKIVVAIPVAPPEAVERLRQEADEVVCMLVAVPFRGVGAYYDDFRQVEDHEAAAILQAFQPEGSAPIGTCRSDPKPLGH